MKPDIWHDPLFLAGLKGGGQGGSASGPIVTFTGDGSPLRALLVNIDPVQDLHGYESPWPSGGGKNKFNGTFLQGYWAYADGRWTDSNAWITTEKIPCKPSTYYTVSAVNKLTRWQGFVWYDENGDYISTTNQQANQNIGYTAESPATAAYMAYNIAGYPNTSSTISPSDVSQFQIEEGRNATSYAPYSNLCPISGWTEANLWRTGKNLSQYTSFASNPANFWGRDIAALVNILNALPIGTYTIGNKYEIVTLPGNGKVSHGRLYVTAMVNGTQTPVTSYAVATDTSPAVGKVYEESGTFTITEDNKGKINHCYAYCDQADTHTGDERGTYNLYDIQLELSSTPTTYAPYTGTSYPITIPTPPGTVYGGYISVSEDGSAELVVTQKIVTLNTSNQTWKYYGNAIWTKSLTDRAYGTDAQAAAISTVLKNANVNVHTGNAVKNYPGCFVMFDNSVQMYICVDNTWTDETVYKTWLDTVQPQLVYELATPIEYPLSDITVQTLAGTNVVWADCGDIAVEWAGGKGFGKEAMLAWVMNR